jgi:hypothetical protein
MADRTQLPVPDYDHLPEGSLRHRIRTLDADGVALLLDYEQAHASRIAIIQALENRLAELRAGASPSGGDPAGDQPEHAPAPAGSSPVTQLTQSDNNQPLRHGVAAQTPNRDIRSR